MTLRGLAGAPVTRQASFSLPTAHHEWMSCRPCAMLALDDVAFRDRYRISSCGSWINLDALLLLRSRPMHLQSHVAHHLGPLVQGKQHIQPCLVGRTRPGQSIGASIYCTCPYCATWAPMRLPNPWAYFRVMTWLVLCSLLLALSACTGASLQAERGSALSAQKLRPQRIAYHGRPIARAARAVPT